MALEKIGVGAVYEFDERQGVKGTQKAHHSAKQLRNELGQFMTTSQRLEARFGRLGKVMSMFANSAKRAQMGVKKIDMGMRNLGMGLLPLSVGLGAGIKKAADFQHQMAAVGAVVRDATAPRLKNLTDKAEELGIKSAFSQAKVGEAMELMGIAGANTQQVMAGIGGVTDLAAAGALDMATASDAVAQGVKIMRLEWEDATRVADVYAMASVSANTTVEQLAQGMKMGGQKARSMGIELEETVAILSRLADAGLKGTLSGTALTNMLVKLSKPGAEARKIMKKWNIQLTDSDGKLKKVSDIVDQFKERMKAVPSVVERARIASELFGIRGERAYQALFVAGSKSLKGLEDSLKKASGKATEMAEKRLDSLKGRIILLASSLESLATKIFKFSLSDIQADIDGFTKSLNKVLFTMKVLTEATEDLSDEALAKDVFEKYDVKIGKTTISIARGISEGINAIRDGYRWLSETLKKLSDKFKDTFGDSAMQSIFKWGTIIAVVGGMLGPLTLALMGLQFVVGGVATFVSGLVTTLSGVFLPALAAIAAVTFAYALLREENESFGETSSRVWGNIKVWAQDVYDNSLKPLWQGFSEEWMPALKGMGKAWGFFVKEVKVLLIELFQAFGFGTTGAETDWKNIGQTIGFVLGNTIKIVGYVAGGIIRYFRMVTFPIQAVIMHFRQLYRAIKEIFSGNILLGLKRLGLSIIDFVIIPIRWAINTMVELARMIPGAEDLIGTVRLQQIKDFAREGLSGIFSPEHVERRQGGGVVDVPKLTDEMKEPGRPEWMETVAGGKAAEKDMSMLADKFGEKVSNAIKDKKTELNIQNQMCVDGEAMNVASSRHKTEIEERTGAKSTPWQRRMMMEHGAVPVRTPS